MSQTPEQQHMDTTSKEFIALMAVLMSVVAISIDAMLPVLGMIGEALNVSHPNQAQYIISGIFTGMALGQLVAGPLSDTMGRKPVLYVSLLIYLVGGVICLTANSIEVMLIGRFVQGLGVSGPYISCMSIVRDRYEGRTMARIMSLIMTIFIMVPVFAPALGQAVVMVTSWRYIFVLYIAYAIIVLLWIAFRLEETLPKAERIPFKFTSILQGAKTVLTNRQTLCYTLCMSCMFGALIGDLNSAQQVFQVQYGVGEMFVVYFGLQALVFGAASLVNSGWVEKLGMRYICLRALGVMTLISFAFFGLHFIATIHFWIFFMWGVVVFFCVGLLFGNLNALALEPMGHIAGIASAIIGATSNVIALMLGTIIGQLYDGTLIPLSLGFALLGLIGWVVMLVAEPRKTAALS